MYNEGNSIVEKLYRGAYLVFAVNADECLMTKMQEMSFGYHFTVEQEVGSTAHEFFGFNGRLFTPENNFTILVLLLPRT